MLRARLAKKRATTKKKADGDEVERLMYRHRRNVDRESPAFFQCARTGLAAHRREPDEAGRGALFFEWPSLEAMRKQWRRSDTRTGSGGGGGGGGDRAVASSTKNTRPAFVMAYETHFSACPDDRIAPALEAYDPEREFVVVMWCRSPPVCHVSVVRADARRNVAATVPNAVVAKGDLRARNAILIVPAACVTPRGESTGRAAIACSRVACGATTRANGRALGLCDRCKTVCYCSAACQRADWARHKPTCVLYDTLRSRSQSQLSTASAPALRSTKGSASATVAPASSSDVGGNAPTAPGVRVYSGADELD